MSNQKLHLPLQGIIDDDAIRSPLSGTYTTPTPALLLPEDFRLTDLLRQLGKLEAAELARPVQLLGPNFKPMAMLAKLKEHAHECSGRAALVLVDREKVTVTLIWSEDAGTSLNKLVNLKLAGAFVVGILTISEDGWRGVYPEPDDCPQQAAFFHDFLNLIARDWSQEPRTMPAFIGQSEAATTLFQSYQWPESGPMSLDEITVPVCTENVQMTGVN